MGKHACSGSILRAVDPIRHGLGADALAEIQSPGPRIKAACGCGSARCRHTSEDLEADGWTVHVDFAPRHTDDYTETGFKDNNHAEVDGIKTNVTSAYNAGARMLLIIGHVVIPYSGYHNPDTHGVRYGPSDLFYVDVDGVWTDTDTNSAMAVIDEEFQYGANDGRFDQSIIPMNSFGVYNGIELGVGRVDFARIPDLGTGDSPSTSQQMQTEVNSIASYFEKVRKYRRSEAPYPLPEQATAWAVNGLSPANIVGRYRAILGTDPSKIVSANSFMQQSASYLFGYTGGVTTDPNGDGFTSSSPLNTIRLWHRLTDFLTPSRMPRIAFAFFTASFHWDWNREMSVLRSLVSSSDFGIASAWDKGRWQIELLALGECLGATQIRNVQAFVPVRNEFNEDVNALGGAPTDGTFFAIVGDPTLRLHYLLPPSSVAMDGLQLNWGASQDPAVSQYLVYRKDSPTSVYARVSSSSLPVSCCSVGLTANDAAATSLMVRSVKTISTGAGSYEALSHGTVFIP